MSCAAMAPARRAECKYGQCTLHTWPEGATSSPLGAPRHNLRGHHASSKRWCVRAAQEALNGRTAESRGGATTSFQLAPDASDSWARRA